MNSTVIKNLLVSVLYKSLAMIGAYFILGVLLVYSFGEMAYNANHLLLLISIFLLFFIMSPNVNVEWKKEEPKKEDE